MTTTPASRIFGIDIVGDVPWGTHLCLFYETKDDLIEILVPYFAEGLRSNEACMWVTSEPLENEEARAALAKAVPNLDQYIASGQLLMLPYTEWHMKGGTFNADRVMQGWLEKEQEALNRGFEGLRLAGNTFWIERSLWDTFTDYEAVVNAVIGDHRMIAVCPYSLEKCGGTDVIDVIRNHVGTIIKQGGAWSVVEDAVYRKEAEEAVKAHADRTTALNEVIHVLNEAPDLQTLYERALPLITERLGFDGGHICVRDATRDVTELKASYHVPRAYADTFRSIAIDASPYLSRLYNRGQPEFVEDYPSAVEERGALSGMKSAVAVPFTSEGTVVGHLGLATVEAHPFTSEELALLTSIGRELGTAVAKLKAKAEAEERAHRQDILTHIITAGNQASDLTTACAAMLDTALDLLPLYYGCIFLLDQQDPGAVILQSAHGYTNKQLEWAQRIPLTQRLTARVMAGTPLFYDDYQAVGSRDAQSMNSEVQSMTFIPLVTGDMKLGFYNLGSRGEFHHFTKDEQELLIAIGEEAGSVIARLQAEEAVKESEARYRSLVERNFDGVIIHSDGVIRYANEAAARIAKVPSPDELIGISAFEISTPKYRELMKQRVQEIYRTHKSSELIEIQMTAGDGTTVDIELSGAFITYEGKPAIYVVARDISERKQIEAQVKQYAAHAEERARQQDILTRIISAGNSATSLQSAVIAMLDTALELLTLDKGGIFLRDSDTMVLQYERGYTAEQRAWAQRIPITQRRVARIMDGAPWISDDYQSDVTPEVREMNKDIASMATVPLVAGDAVVGFYQLVSFQHPHHFSGEEQNLLIAIGKEAGTVIARLRAEDAVKTHADHLGDLVEERTARLTASEKQYRTLVETADSIILTFDAQGFITFINEYGARFYGYTVDELIGQHTGILVPEVESTGRPLKPLIDSIVADPNAFALNINENITKDGRTVWTRWTNKSLTDVNGKHIGDLAIGNDITEQVRAEAALKNAERLAGIGQTAAMIGHDLRNPLQGLQYIVDLQKLRFERIPPDKRSAEDWQKEQALFDRISEQIFYMDKIVGDLQDYARPLDPEREAVSVRALIDEVIGSLPPADGVELRADLPDLTIDVESHLMHRVFSNLFLNAMQAMPDGGTLTIGAETADGSVVIHITDTGVGIPADMRDKLFSPLTTGKAKGTGLGLAVVKRIVEAHNGTITFESEEGKGTTFTVTLPQTAE